MKVRPLGMTAVYVAYPIITNSSWNLNHHRKDIEKKAPKLMDQN